MPFKIIGSIVKPFGLKGNLLVKSEYITFSDFSSLKNLFIGHGETPEEVFEIESINIHNKFFNVKLKNIDTRKRVEMLRKSNVFLPERELSKFINIAVEEDDYLIGFEVFDNNGKFLGNIKFCDEYPAYKILTITGKNEKEFMVPMVDKFIKSVDKSDNKIVINVLPGLIDED